MIQIKVDPDHRFFSFTTEELYRAATILVDTRRIQEALDNGDDDLVDFVYDKELREYLLFGMRIDVIW